jgi:uncharacterized protein YcgL (UPF0745 family)
MKSCKVYRSEKKAETYLYLADDTEFEDLPDELRKRFGEPVFVLGLELTTDRKLARVEAEVVLASLSEHGFYLQLPPKLPVEEEIARNFSRIRIKRPDSPG